jgi:hypothetical protein
LDSKNFAIRDRAEKALEKAGDAAEGPLRRALDKGGSLNLRRALERLLARLSDMAPAAERLRQLRALEVLENLRTPEARAVLESLSAGPPEAWLTRQATAALARQPR